MTVLISDAVAAALLTEAVEELERTSDIHYQDVPKRVPLLAFVSSLRYTRPELFEIIEDADEVLEYERRRIFGEAFRAAMGEGR